MVEFLLKANYSTIWICSATTDEEIKIKNSKSNNVYRTTLSDCRFKMLKKPSHCTWDRLSCCESLWRSFFEKFNYVFNGSFLVSNSLVCSGHKNIWMSAKSKKLAVFVLYISSCLNMSNGSICSGVKEC